MGADFVFNYVAIKQGKEQEAKKKLLKATEKFDIPELSKNTRVKIISSLEKKESEEFADFCELWEDELNGDFEDKMPLDRKTGKIMTEEEAREVMKKIIEDFFECLNFRDVGTIEHKGDTIYISGGMSWGDTPTDSCSTINKFINLPQKILKAGGII